MIKRLLLLLTLLFSHTLSAMQVDLEFTDIEGNEIKLSDYRGKWVVLNYWATWCPPCLEEIPELVHFHETHKDSDGVVVGIDRIQGNISGVIGTQNEVEQGEPPIEVNIELVRSF